MKKTAGLLFVVAVAIALTGCDAFFEMNLFEGFEKGGLVPDTATIEAMTVTDIENLAQSDSFYEELALEGNSGTKDTFITQLEGIIADPDSTPTEVQTAALIESNIYLMTTSASDATNNLVNYLTENSNPDYTTFDQTSITGFVDAIVPAEAMADPLVFTAMIEAYEASYNSLMIYGSMIEDPNADPAVDMAVPGEIAMNAMMCALVTAIDPVDPSQTTAEVLLLLLADDVANDPSVTFDTTMVEGNTALSNILIQAGLGTLLPQ